MADPTQTAPIAASHSVLDVYFLMLEKSPANTIIFTGLTLLLVLAILIFIVLASSKGLREFLHDLLKGIQYQKGKFVFRGGDQDGEAKTDDKGNVKPPEPSGVEEEAKQEGDFAVDRFYWLFLLKVAYREPGDCLKLVEDYYEKAKAATGNVPLPLLDAEYALARFRCGDNSALATLKAMTGPSTEAFYANRVLADYQEAIGDEEEYLKLITYQVKHPVSKDHKIFAAIRLSHAFSSFGKFDDAVSLLESQLGEVLNKEQQALLWDALGDIYGQANFRWTKHLCLEKSLLLDPDNARHRFALAYSYGETMETSSLAAHHYRILLQQTPRDSMGANNLAVIYGEIGAVSQKIDLLRNAQRRKDSGFVGANLARAYVKAGFLADARDCLESIPENERQKDIVQGAYREIKTQQDKDSETVKRLEKRITIERKLINLALERFRDADDAHAKQPFVGEWQADVSTTVYIRDEDGKLAGFFRIQNPRYEILDYDVTSSYESGILELDGVLNETTLKTKSTSAFGYGSLLGDMFARPKDRIKFTLVAVNDKALQGVKISSSSTEPRERAKELVLGAEEVNFERVGAKE